MAKNRELYNHIADVLANGFKILESADIKQSGAKDGRQNQYTHQRIGLSIGMRHNWNYLQPTLSL
jgi:hypothetical protein